MADIINVNTSTKTAEINAYLKNRLKYHAASRLASQTGEGLAQAMNVDGHTITTAKVWAAPATAFPNNADKDNVDAVDATNDLVTVFKTSVDGSVVESKDFWAANKSGAKTGKVWTNTAYPAVKLYENVPMTAVKGSDGGGKFQAFEILAAEDGYSEGTLRVSDWIAPTAVADRTTGKVVAGFSGIPMYSGAALTKDTGRWAATLGTWEFVYMAGMLTFEPGFTPQDKASTAVDAKTFKSLVTLTAFKYDGEYLVDSISSIDKKIEDAITDLGTTIAGAKEIAEVTVALADGTATPADSGKVITSAVTGGKVSMTIDAEVLSVKQGTEEIQPDMTFADGVTTLVADYGTVATDGLTWTLTYRI